MTNIKNDHFSGGSNINKGSRCRDDSTLDEILKELDTTGFNIWDKSLGSGDVFLKSVANVDLQTKNILNINNINVNTILVKSINGIDYTPGSVNFSTFLKELRIFGKKEIPDKIKIPKDGVILTIVEIQVVF